MLRRMKIMLATFAAISAGVLVGPLDAASVSLDSLIAGGTLTSGDKTISDVSYLAVGNMPDASDILVTPISDGSNYGFRFMGGFFDQGGDDRRSDAFLEFTVTVDEPNLEIIGATLFGNPSVSGSGAGCALVTETFLPAITDQQLVIYDMQPGGFKGLDSVIFDKGHTTLTVQKDILLEAGVEANASLSFFDQYFLQQPTLQPVPEPSAAGLLLFGFLGLLGNRRARD